MFSSKFSAASILAPVTLFVLCGFVSSGTAQNVLPSNPTTARPVDPGKDLDKLLNGPSAEPAKNFDEVIDRAINRERILISKLNGKEPVIETYIQEMKSDSELGAVPDHDYYYLGKLDLTNGIMHSSLIAGPAKGKKIPHVLAGLFSTEYNPRGFADMMFPDEKNFDRAHYKLEYVRREFLGDVRCIVADVSPLKNAGNGRFEGRVWIEDRDYTIVRFNGRYVPAPNDVFAHFDSWRVNTAGLWLPSYIYSEDEGWGFGPVHTAPMRAQTRIWDYESEKAKSEEAFTELTIDVPQGVKDQSETAVENSPVEAKRLWEDQAEDNIVHRLQDAGLLAPPGEVDQVLDTVLTNLEVTNNIDTVDPPIRVRILLTTPLESVAVNRTILVSRGLIDVLPDEACLAAVLAHELAHILLGHSVNTKYAFADRLLFDDKAALSKISIARTQQEEQLADEKALAILKNSPYKDKLPRVGLFLRMLSARSNELPHLIRPLIGNPVADTHKDMRLSGLMELSPELQIRNPEQIAALPLGSRVRMDPWSDQLHMLKTHNVALLSAKEKLPFEITPFMLHLTREATSAH